MTRQSSSRSSFIKATVFFAAWLCLQVAIYLPSTINQDPSDRAYSFAVLAGVCFLSSVVVGVLSWRSSNGYSWVKFGAIYVVVYVLVFILSSFVTNN